MSEGTMQYAGPATPVVRRRPRVVSWAARNLPFVSTLVICAALYTAACLRYDGFFSGQVFVNFFSDNAFLGIAAVGMTFVILSGGIDLSVGAMIGFISIFVATLTEKHGIHPKYALPLALLVGSTFGFFYGCLIHFFGLAPFLVTLAGLFLAKGLATVITLESVGITHPWLSKLSAWAIEVDFAPAAEWPVVGAVLRATGLDSFAVGIPAAALLFLAMVLLGAYLLRYTRFGRNVYAVGGSEQSAGLMGLPVGRTKILIYTFSGFCSGLAGIVYGLYTLSGNPIAGSGLELDAIAAVVIGGTLLTGGVGSVAGTLLGVLILGIIQTAISFQGDLSSWWTKIVVGLLLFVFIVLQKVLTKARRA